MPRSTSKSSRTLFDASIGLLSAPDADSLAIGLVAICTDNLGAEAAAVWLGDTVQAWMLTASAGNADWPLGLAPDHAYRSGDASDGVQFVEIGNVGLLALVSAARLTGRSRRYVEAVCNGLFQRWSRERLLLRKKPWKTASRLEAILRRIDAAVLVEDEDRHIVLVNEKFCNLFGIPVPPEDLVGADCSNAAQESKQLFADPEGFVRRIERILAERKEVLSERLEMADGKVVDRDFLPVIIDDLYYGHLWVYRDITERQREISRLDAQRLFYEQILETTPAQLRVFDRDLRFEYVSPSAVSNPEERAMLSGLTEREYCIRHGFDPEAAERRMARLAEVRESRNLVVVEESVPTPEGGVNHFVRFIAPVVTDEVVTHVLEYSLDSTDRREAEDRLRRSEAESRAVVNVSFDAVITANSDGRIVEFSRAAERIFGRSRDEVLDSDLADVIIPPDLRDAHRAGLNRYVSTGVSTVLGRLLELPALRSDGSIFDAEVVIEAIGERGPGQLFTAFVRDVSDRKQFERELISARRVAEEATRATEHFLATVSHDLRTPLNAILGLTHLSIESTRNRQMREYLSSIKFSAEHLRLLINDILDVARIHSGQVIFERRTFDLRVRVDNVIGLTAVRAAEKSLTLDLHVDDDVPAMVVADPVRFTQILLNLIGNAIKFTTEGGVSVFVGRESVSEVINEAWIRVAVRDSGVGISKEDIERIFEPFVQGNNPSAGVTVGSGLGLHIVREIVALQGGSIEVSSRPGQGSTFTVRLPMEIAEPLAAPAKRLGIHSGTPLAGVRVLLVEDDKLNQAVAGGMLTRWGALVTFAPNGVLAVERVRSDGFDVILMDIQMPVMDGLEAARQIRMEHGDEVPIIALTATGVSDFSHERLPAGMNDLVLKPFDPIELLERIIEHLPDSTGGLAGHGSVGAKVDADTSAAVHVPGQGAGRGVVNVDMLNQQTMGRPDFLRRLVDLFRVHAPRDLADLETAVGMKSWADVRAVAHRLKSSAGTLGISPMRQELARLEADAASEDPNVCTLERVGSLQAVYLQAQAELDEIIRRLAP